MKPVKSILFDIGNVILFFDNHRVSEKIAEITNQSEDKIFKVVFGLYAETEIDLGKISSKEFLERVKSKLHLKIDLENLKFIFSDIFMENKKMTSLIKMLKGKVPLLGITNTNESHFKFIKKNFPILDLLDHIIPSYEIGVKKPSAGIYFEALKYVRARPEECLFIDDQEKNIIPASLLGFKTHRYRTYEDLVHLLHRLGILQPQYQTE
jgi:putative hydrolase of the HAD superfamily